MVPPRRERVLGRVEIQPLGHRQDTLTDEPSTAVQTILQFSLVPCGHSTFDWQGESRLPIEGILARTIYNLPGVPAFVTAGPWFSETGLCYVGDRWT